MIRDDQVGPADHGSTPDVPPLGAEIEVGDLLNGLVVVTVGRGGPVQAAVNRALRAAGAIVLAKTSTADVIRMLDVFLPSVVVTEIVPGDDEGLALLRELRQPPAGGGRGMPIIGVSWETRDPEPILQAGFHGALVGPFDALDVARAILKAVRRRG